MKRFTYWRSGDNWERQKPNAHKWGYFVIKNDLEDLQLFGHNLMHVIGSFIIALLWGFWAGYLFWFAWELFDGIKPWWFTFNKTGKAWRDFLVENLLYSDKFSLQDAFIWNLLGSSVGGLVYIWWSRRIYTIHEYLEPFAPGWALDWARVILGM